MILARLNRPAMIALDDVDAGLDAGEQADLCRMLAEITAAGTAVLVTAREIDAAHGATVIRLGGTVRRRRVSGGVPGFRRSPELESGWGCRRRRRR